MKRLLLALLVALVSFGAPAAFAAWGPGTLGAGSSASRSLGPPTSITANGTSTSSVNISWSSPTAPSVSPAQYVVRRVAPTSATVCSVGSTTFACADTGLPSGTTFSYTVESRVGANWFAVAPTVSAQTLPQPTFVVAPPATAQPAGSSFAAVITATTNGSTVDISYTGVKTLTFSGPGLAPNGSSPTYPTSVTFAAGIGTAWITLVRAETVSLQVTDGTRAGTGSVTIASAAANRLVYTTSTPSCTNGSVIVANGGSFASRVSVVDAFGNAVSGARTIALSRVPASTGTLAPTTLSVPAGASETSASFTYTLPVGNPPDVTVIASSAGLTSAQCVVRKNDH
jgi:hypothetical protein